MTDVMMLREIVSNLRSFIDDEGILGKLDGNYDEIKVYEQDIPEKRDEDDEDLVNYICIMIGDQDTKEDELVDRWHIEVHFAIMLEDTDIDHSGNIDVLNLMNEIYMHFIKIGNFAGHLKMLPDAHKRLNFEARYPYYEGDIVTYWELPLPFEELEVDI